MEILFVLVPVVIVCIVAVVVFQMAKALSEWADNNSKPILAAPARVTAKRAETGGNVSQQNGGSVSTWYYATFELESGERMEFLVPGPQFGLLAEGDRGTLTYQGTRYHGFERRRGDVQ